MPILLDGKPVKVEDLPPDKQRLLAEYTASLERYPLHSYQPHPKQAAFHASQRRTKAFLGGNRSGKSHAGIADDLIQACDAEALPEHLRRYKRWEPPFKCRICAPKFNENHEGVIFPKIRELVPKDQLLGGNWKDAFKQQRRMLFFENGSWLQFLTYEQDLDAFSGADLHRVHYDEEPPGEKGRQIHQENAARLIDHAGDVLFTMTPLFGLSWTYDLLWQDRGPETQKGVYESEGLTVVSVDMDENPHIDQASKDIYLASLPEKVREARKSGRFVHFSGLVYEEFDPEVHLCPRPSRDHVQGLEEHREAIDPGVNTTAVIFAGFDKDNSMLVYDELYLHGDEAIPANAAERIKQKREEWGVQPRYTLIDPSARNRQLTNADNVQAAFYREGIQTWPAQNELEAGVFEVKRRFDRELIVISEECGALRNELARYRKEQREDGAFGVVKGNDHAADGVRYLAMSRPLAPPRAPRQDKPKTWTPGTAPPFTGRRTQTKSPLGSYA